MPSGNNRLFRATSVSDDWVVKFAIRGDRDRGRREFNSLSLMDRLGAGIAPRPVACDLDGYEQAVVVQTWVEGTTLWSPPDDDATWLQILKTYRRVHEIKPADATRLGLMAGPLLGPFLPDEQVAAVTAFARQLPEAGQSQRLTQLIETLQPARFPNLPQTRCWGHGDPNLRNMTLTASGVKLVDWEYSGVTDPAKEFAQLMSHAIAVTAGEARYDWIAEHYAGLSDEPDILPRIRAQYALQLAAWCVRLLFGYHVLLRQTSRRLVGHGPEEEISTLENIDRYFEMARRQLAR